MKYEIPNYEIVLDVEKTTMFQQYLIEAVPKIGH